MKLRSSQPPLPRLFRPRARPFLVFPLPLYAMRATQNSAYRRSCVLLLVDFGQCDHDRSSSDVGDGEVRIHYTACQPSWNGGLAVALTPCCARARRGAICELFCATAMPVQCECRSINKHTRSRGAAPLLASAKAQGNSTEMQVNTWARLRESSTHQGAIHAT